jgi:hypothetical protein
MRPDDGQPKGANQFGNKYSDMIPIATIPGRPALYLPCNSYAVNAVTRIPVTLTPRGHP